jgi:type I restriction enzyme, S subunit
MKEIPPHWKTAKLGEVCFTTSGGTPSRKRNDFYNGNIPWVKSGELEHNIILATEEKITEEALKNSNAKVFPKGTLLIALYGATIGKLAILGIDAATNQAICGIFQSNQVVSKFLYFFLFSLKQKLINQGIGGAQPNISQGLLKETLISLPPLPDQHLIVAKIEELFSELDNAVENLKKAKVQLKVYRQAVLKWAFEGKLTEEWRKEKESQNTKYQSEKEEVRVAAEEVQLYELKKIIPITWRFLNLGKTGLLQRGKSKHRPRNDKKLFGGKYPFIQTGEIKAANGGIIKEFEKTYSDIGLSQSKLWPKGTLCITIAANIAETAFLGFDSCFPDSIVGFVPDNSIADSKYINYFLISIKSRIENLAPATAQKNINISILDKLAIPIPDLSEQYQIVQEIETRFSVADKLEQSIEQSLQQAEALRQSILKRAFEGRLIEFDLPKNKDTICRYS